MTTLTNDTDNHVAAWNSFNQPAIRFRFNHMGVPQDDEILAAAKSAQPEVIFYIGACNGFGLPSVAAFRALRHMAPTINICSDAADTPWHQVLEYYKRKECFDLQVSLDGAYDAPVDLVTVTPIDPRPFTVMPEPFRDIPCGFSGTVGRAPARRAVTFQHLRLRNLLTVRHRAKGDTYRDHVAFMRRCKVALNTSRSGSGEVHHLKGRVIEAGWAGCALLESIRSPADRFLPCGSFVQYAGIPSIATLLEADRGFKESALLLAAHVREHYTPQKIYGAMLECIGLVDTAEQVTAA